MKSRNLLRNQKSDLSEWLTAKTTDYGHPERAFFQKLETFGLGQTNWAEILGGIWGRDPSAPPVARLLRPCSDSGRDNALADEDGLWWGEDSTNPRGIHLENVQSTKLCRQFRLVSPSSAGRPAALVATPLEQQQSIYGDQNDPQPTNLTRFFPSKKIMGLLRR
jgi:hypothetical protein